LFCFISFRFHWRYQKYSDLNILTFADYLKPMFLVSINTGIPQGEMFNLCWNDINFERAILTVNGSNAKSGKTRYIPLNSEALLALKNWRAQQPNDNSTMVFQGKNGNRFNNIKKSWAALLNAAQITHFRWHDLRHHFASKLAMAGVDLNTIRELLGHADLKMTLRYAHLASEHKASAVEKLVTHLHKDKEIISCG
jgi:integrase